MPSSTDRWVIVLNFEGRADTLELLGDLDVGPRDFTVLVVDNGSSDGLLDHLASTERWSWVRILQTGANLGYAGGNNAGIRMALDEGAASICVLNNDTRAQPRALSRLFALATENVALCPDIAFVDDREGSWFRGARFDHHLGRPVHLGPLEQPSGAAPFASPYLTGCCLVAPAEVWQRVGLFDETYFLIFEDSDWSVRATAADVRLEVHPEVRIQHKVSRSFTGARQGLALYFFCRNGLRFAYRHGSSHSVWRFVMAEVLGPAAREISRAQFSSALVRLIAIAAFPTRRQRPGYLVEALSRRASRAVPEVESVEADPPQ